MKYYKDELVEIWRRSYYEANDIQEVIKNTIDPYSIEHLTEFSSHPIKTEIYNTETDDLVYESESEKY